MRLRAALAVALAVPAVTVVALVALGVPAAEGLMLWGISAGGALAVGLLGTALLRLMPQAAFFVQMSVVVVAGVGAVAAGALAASAKMLLPAEDLPSFVVVIASAGTVGALVSLTLSRRVRAAQISLTAAARRLADGSEPAAGAPPIREFAALAADLEETRRRLAESRERERRLDAARRDLMTWLSHDLRTPLAGIRALAEALEDEVVDDPETVSRYHRRLGEQAARVADMVEDLFALSRISSGAVAPARTRVALGDLLSDSVAAAEAVASRQGVVLEADDAGQVDVRVAPADIARVLDNLLSNAIRETPRGGRVAVAVRAGDAAVDVTVTDACGGLPAEVKQRLFDPGYRGAPARTPSAAARGGFGLTIARGLAEAHGGTLEVEAAAGGCTFRLTLPRATSAATVPQDRDPDGSAPRGRPADLLG